MIFPSYVGFDCVFGQAVLGTLTAGSATIARTVTGYLDGSTTGSISTTVGTVLGTLTGGGQPLALGSYTVRLPPRLSHMTTLTTALCVLSG